MATIQPTSYTEINRIHRTTLSAHEGTMVITCSRAGEGTSLLAYTMALRAAEGGKKALLVDLNMKNTKLTHDLALKRKDWKLHENAPVKVMKGLVEADKKNKNLFYLAAPRDQDTVTWLKDLTHAEQCLNALKTDYDYVIIDSTPIGIANRYNADPVILAAAADRTVMTMLSGVTPRERVRRALRQLREGGANVEGLVVNDRYNPSLRDQMLNFADGLKGLSPSFSGWLRQKISNSEALS